MTIEMLRLARSNPEEHLEVMLWLLKAIFRLERRRERIVLLSYFCCGETCQQIADNLGLSITQVFRDKKKALEGILNDGQSVTGEG